jgi:hypothetical protein
MQRHPIRRHAEVPWRTLQILSAHGGTICGGFARHVASSNNDSKSNDVDIYPQNEGSLQALTGAIRELQKDSGWGDWMDDPTNYHGVKAQKANIMENGKLYKVQLVHLADHAESILGTFDFTVCQAYLDFYSQTVVAPDYWKAHEDGRYLRLANTSRKYLSYRMIKYMDKGYMPDYETVVNFMAQMEISSTGVNIGQTSSEELANWLGMVYGYLAKENQPLAEKVSVLGQLLDSPSFHGTAGMNF